MFWEFYDLTLFNTYFHNPNSFNSRSSNKNLMAYVLYIYDMYFMIYKPVNTLFYLFDVIIRTARSATPIRA